MVKKKSLAEELTDLFNPAPTKEFDPDADIFGSGPVLEASDDELQVPSTRRKGKESRRLLGDIELEGKEYSGRKVSRKEIYGDEALDGFAAVSSDDDEDDDEEGSSDFSEEDEEDDEDQEMDDDSDDDGEVSEEEFAGKKANGAAKMKRKAASSSDDDDDEEDYELGNKRRKSTAEDEMAALERELAEVQQSEQAAAAHLQERAAKERQKAIAVKAQKQGWNKALELRITLQKALQNTNKLPDPEIQQALVQTDETVAEKYNSLATKAAGTLGEILSLLRTLTERHSGMAEAAAEVNEANQSDGEEDDDDAPLSDKVWQQWDKVYSGFVPFRDASIDRWHRKTVLGAAGRNNMKVLNQNVSSQVEALMKDADRMVERTRMPRQQVQKIATQAAVEAPESDQEEDIDDRDPETYDDTEFYQTLLKEFLDSKSDAIGVNWYTGPKQRKAVDRRASKGRKLRYHVHEKLVNFMTPVELEAPQFATSVFTHLFGGGVK